MSLELHPILLSTFLLTVILSTYPSSKVINDSTINFIVTNSDGPSVLSLPHNASVIDLHAAAVVSCGVLFPFELQLAGETITSSLSQSNQSIDQIPIIISTANDLHDIWGSVGFRIPLKISRIVLFPTNEDIAIYASLYRMFGGPGSNIHKFEWYQYIMHCVESGSCFVDNLCYRFHAHFRCTIRKHLSGLLIDMDLRRQNICGHLNISEIPRTVKKMDISRNSLNAIVGFDHMAHSNLKYLDIVRNPLDLDMRSFMAPNNNPLRVLRVQACQVSLSLIGLPFRQCFENWNDDPTISERIYYFAVQWIELSSLNNIILEPYETHKNIKRKHIIVP